MHVRSTRCISDWFKQVCCGNPIWPQVLDWCTFLLHNSVGSDLKWCIPVPPSWNSSNSIHWLWSWTSVAAYMLFKLPWCGSLSGVQTVFCLGSFSRQRVWQWAAVLVYWHRAQLQLDSTHFGGIWVLYLACHWTFQVPGHLMNVYSQPSCFIFFSFISVCIILRPCSGVAFIKTLTSV